MAWVCKNCGHVNEDEYDLTCDKCYADRYTGEGGSSDWAQKIMKVGIRKEPGYLYFVDEDGDIEKVPEEKVESEEGLERPFYYMKIFRAEIKKEPGYRYFVDKDGDIARVKGRMPMYAFLVDEDGNIIGERCPFCNTVLRNPDALFCPNCRFKLKKEGVKCYNCGKPIHEGDKYCENCGAKLNVSA